MRSFCLILVLVMFCGCSNRPLEKVTIVHIQKPSIATLAYVNPYTTIEFVTGERYRMLGTLGGVGDTFSISRDDSRIYVPYGN